MKSRYPALFGLCTLVAGCATAPDATNAAQEPLGYRYHDANHSNTVASPSEQAIQNARHGIWLWPPAGSIRTG